MYRMVDGGRNMREVPASAVPKAQAAAIEAENAQYLIDKGVCCTPRLCRQLTRALPSTRAMRCAVLC
jgi:hypothetical protein